MNRTGGGVRTAGGGVRRTGGGAGCTGRRAGRPLFRGDGDGEGDAGNMLDFCFVRAMEWDGSTGLYGCLVRLLLLLSTELEALSTKFDFDNSDERFAA